ncbi:AMP-binding protein [Corynebacterium sp. CCUG 18816]|uniref:AMP-binding protein n=1 Tax=Corynebacterium pseudogenitalium TaxID=38303 RepID=UPI00210A84E0|nr:AMP-binding protein [Corynebacterium pseudogenitalium]MCQ4616751.1 AMP-binding protein [Corynebacterium pseudogenitalium]
MFLRFLSAAHRAGMISPGGGAKAAVGVIPNLLRFRFTTARAIEQGHLAFPDRTALIDNAGLLTYRELRNQARNIARWILNVTDQPRIGVIARNGRGIILPLGAKGYTGGSIFLLNVGSSTEQLRGCIEENNINILFTDDEFLPRIPDMGKDMVVVDEAKLTSISEERGDAALPLFPKHGDIVLMSSGTSGIPKGILRAEPALPIVAAGYLEAIPFRAGDTVQMTASMFHTWGWSALNITLGVGGTIVTQRVFDPANAFRQLEHFRCDGLISSPIFLKHMLDLEEDYDTSRLRFIGTAGNALTPLLAERLIDRFGPIVANIYGSTELALAAAADATTVANDPTCVGRVPPGTTLRIYDDAGREVPTGTVGRIFLNNETALRGYTNPDTPIVTIDGLIEMGDLGYFDNQGLLHVVSRSDDMIIVGGENVHPQSVAAVLERMPGIDDLYVGSVDDPDTFKRVATWIVRADDPDGQALTAASVQGWVRDHLAEHSVPRDVHFVDALPRNATGKVVPREL